MNDNPTVELVLFRLKPGVEEAAFLEAADAIQSAVVEMGGFIRRELLRNEEGQWADVLHWNSLEEAHHAAEAILSDSRCDPFLGMIDEPSITMLHLQTARRY
jgi:heme-degrading monooxygenase HmoA